MAGGRGAGRRAGSRVPDARLATQRACAAGGTPLGSARARVPGARACRGCVGWESEAAASRSPERTRGPRATAADDLGQPRAARDLGLSTARLRGSGRSPRALAGRRPETRRESGLSLRGRGRGRPGRLQPSGRAGPGRIGTSPGQVQPRGPSWRAAVPPGAGRAWPTLPNPAAARVPPRPLGAPAPARLARERGAEKLCLPLWFAILACGEVCARRKNVLLQFP